MHAVPGRTAGWVAVRSAFLPDLGATEVGQQYGVPTGNGGTKIAVALSQQDLAAFVGVSMRAVAREMESWRIRGIIATGRRWVVVQRPSDLRRIAGPDIPPT